MDIFSIFFNMKVCCMFSLESPHRGVPNKYTKHTIFNKNKKKTPQIIPNIIISAAMGFFPGDSRMSLK